MTATAVRAPGWIEAGHHPELGPGEVHVWRIELDHGDDHLGGALHPDEVARAARYRFDVHRRRFVAGRAALRSILGRYLGTGPGAVSFRYGAWGKPALAGPTDVEFNVSHSEGLALCAVSRGLRVGVDLERLRTDAAVDELAGGQFSPGERAALLELSGPARVEAFFRCWTRKEAYAKATGRGLSLAFDEFEVTVDPGPQVRLVPAASDGSAPARWSLLDLRPGDGFVAALAVETASPPPVLLRHWPCHHRPKGETT